VRESRPRPQSSRCRTWLARLGLSIMSTALPLALTVDSEPGRQGEILLHSNQAQAASLFSPINQTLMDAARQEGKPEELTATEPGYDDAQSSLVAAFKVLAAQLKQAGIDAGLFANRAAEGLGGPFEPVSSADEASPPTMAPLPSAVIEAVMSSMPLAEPLADMTIRSGYGVRTDPFTGRKAYHRGLDIPAVAGEPVLSTAGGKVLRSGWAGAYGNMVEVESGLGIVIRYGHLSRILVKQGAEVEVGQKIGLAGRTGRATGVHLHYEVRIDDQAVDPTPFLKAGRSISSLDPG
jgi:murein DD-endopeptidase MepM/ murein hydrolase activator NlpD